MKKFLPLCLLVLAPLAMGGPSPTAAPPTNKPKPVAPKVVPPKVQGHPTGSDDPKVYYSYGTLDYTTTDERLILTRSVVFEYKDTIFKSDKVLYDRKEKIASSPSPVQLDDAQNTITGERGTAFYKLKTAKIEGNVKIIARPKPDNPQSPRKGLRKDFDSPVDILCNSVTYNWKNKIAIPEGNIRISFSIKRNKKTQKWNVTSDTMEYNGNTETVQLKGNVKARADNGDKLNGDSGTVILKEGIEELKIGQASGNFDSDQIDEDEKPEKKETPPPTEKKTGGSGSDRVE
jgi:lipopolysaccharide assembly outer membrane protein LptD (OstA)